MTHSMPKLRPSTAASSYAAGGNKRNKTYMGFGMNQEQNDDHGKDVNRMSYDLKMMQAKQFKQKFVDPLEKEKMYEDIQGQKMTINKCKDENVGLKYKVTQLEREVYKQKRIIDKTLESENFNVVDTIKSPIQQVKYGKESYIYQALKRQVQDLKEQIEWKKQEDEKIKRSTRFTKLQELEIEKKLVAEETVRLRTLLDSIIAENNHFKDQQKQINYLSSTLNFTTIEKDKLFEENLELKQLKQINTKKLQDAEWAASKFELKYKEDMECMKNKLYNERYKTRAILDPFQTSVMKRDMEKSVSPPKSIQMSPPKRIQQQSPPQQKVNDDQLRNNIEQLKQKDKQIDNLKKKISDHEKERREQSQQRSGRKEKIPENAIPKVTKEQIQSMIKQIKYDFIDQQIEFGQLENKIIPAHLKQKNRIQQNDLKAVLEQPPFYLQENQVNMLCSYLTESNTSEKFIVPNPDIYFTVNNISKHFIDVFTEYDIDFTSNTSIAEKLQSQIIQNLKPHIDNIRHFLIKKSKGKQFVDYFLLQNAFTDLNISISRNAWDFLVYNLYMKNKTIDFFAIRDVINNFQTTKIQTQEKKQQSQPNKQQVQQQPVVQKQQEPVKKQVEQTEIQEQKVEQKVEESYEKVEESVEKVEEQVEKVQEEEVKEIVDENMEEEIVEEEIKKVNQQQNDSQVYEEIKEDQDIQPEQKVKTHETVEEVKNQTNQVEEENKNQQKEVFEELGSPEETNTGNKKRRKSRDYLQMEND